MCCLRRSVCTITLRLLFNLLLDSSANLEIEERSVKNIAQKVQLNLVTPRDLAANHAHQLGYILKWLNDRFKHATAASLVNCYSILSYVATCEVSTANLIYFREEEKFFPSFRLPRFCTKYLKTATTKHKKKLSHPSCRTF